MRIALFSQTMATGAFATVFSGLAHALASNGVEAIDLLTLKGDMAAPVHPFPSTARAIRLSGGSSWRAIPALRRYLQAERPAALISGPIIPNLAATLAMLAAYRWRGKLILSHHHPVGLARSQSWKHSAPLVRLLYPRAQGSFAVSPPVREEIIKLAGLDPERVACIPNALPPPGAVADAPPHPWLAPDNRGGPVFVCVCRLEPVKNLPLLLDAFSRVGDRLDARLLMIGGGRCKERLRQTIAEKGLGYRVRLLGYVAQPRAFLRAADAFVLASDEEGFGQALAEAMREGLPVIATDAAGGGSRFVLDEGRAGMLVPRGDVDALAAALTKMAEPQIRAHYAERARRRARDFEPSLVGAALLRLIEALPERGARNTVSLSGT